MNCSEIIFSRHAVERIFERGLRASEAVRIIEEGETIRSYLDDSPYPSFLLLGYIDGRAIHLLVARDPDTLRCIVVTIYQPDPDLWDAEHKRKRDS